MKKLNEGRLMSSLYIICYFLTLGALILMKWSTMVEMGFVSGLGLLIALIIFSIIGGLVVTIIVTLFILMPVWAYRDWLYERM